MTHRTRPPDVALVTDAKRPLSEDIAYRERRYLLMMGIRVLCFIVTIVLFAAHCGWISAIPAVGAIVIPYFAVVFANGGREPDSSRGFRLYEPNLPEPYARRSEFLGERSPSATSDEAVTSAGDDAAQRHSGSPEDYTAH